MLLLLGLLCSCSNGSASPPRPSAQDNRAAVEAVLAELEDSSAVEQVTGGYETAAVSYGSIGITMTVADGTPVAEQDALLDRAEELVWRSPADPINGLGVRVVETSTPSTAPGRARLLQGRTEVAQLAKKYGPRPTPR